MTSAMNEAIVHPDAVRSEVMVASRRGIRSAAPETVAIFGRADGSGL
jgi:hypothetical protein